jgi:hypothetical protein
MPASQGHDDDFGGLGRIFAETLGETDERLPEYCSLFKDRCDTTVVLAGG